MNLITMRTRLRERINSPSTTDVLDATLTLRINEAYTDIWDRYRFYANRSNQTVSTVASTNYITLDAAVDVVLGVRDTTAGKLRKIDRDLWLAIYQQGTARPTSYYRENSLLYLDPCPDAIYSLKIPYKVAITELVSDSDTPTIPSSWHPGILLLSRYKYWDTVGNWQSAQAAWSIWQNWVSDKTDEIAEELMADSDITMQPHGLGPTTPRLDFDHSDDWESQ